MSHPVHPVDPVQGPSGTSLESEPTSVCQEKGEGGNDRPARSMADPSSGRAGVWLFALLFLCYVYVHQDPGGGTSASRLDLLHALVVKGTFAIDAYAHNTSDKASYRGHYYSDKPPGTVVVALPAFAVGIGVLRLSGVDPESPEGWVLSSWIATAGSVAWITALGGVFFFFWLRRWIEPKPALVTTLAVFLGAAPFPYSTMMFSHGMAVALVAAALSASGPVGTPGPAGESRWRDYSAGFCLGFALASEYTAGLVIVGLFVLLAGMRKGRTLRLLAGALPPLLLIPAYNWICFENPFVVGYSYQATFPEMQRGLFGIRGPSGRVLYEYLLGPTRGLLFWTPFLALALAGYPTLFCRSRPMFWAALVIPLVDILCFSGYGWDWRAGWTLGPRYLAPLLPLLGLAAGLGLRRWPRFGPGLAVASVLLTGLGTLVDATPQYEIANPLTELHIPKLIAGTFTHNLGQLAGLPSYASLIPLVLGAACYGTMLWREIDKPRPCP